MSENELHDPAEEKRVEVTTVSEPVETEKVTETTTETVTEKPAE